MTKEFHVETGILTEVKTSKVVLTAVIEKPFSSFGEYRDDHEHSRSGDLQSYCFMCSRMFKNEDNIFLSYWESHDNVFLCESCKDLALESCEKNIGSGLIVKRGRYEES
jgi:hypothetical protein